MALVQNTPKRVILSASGEDARRISDLSAWQLIVAGQTQRNQVRLAPLWLQKGDSVKINRVISCTLRYVPGQGPSTVPGVVFSFDAGNFLLSSTEV